MSVCSYLTTCFSVWDLILFMLCLLLSYGLKHKK